MRLRKKVINTSYLIDKFKGTYRLKVPYDFKTKDYNRKLNGTLEDIDVYIDCSHGMKIYHYGRDILQAYIPSIGTGKNIIKTIYANYINPGNCTKEVKRYPVERNGEEIYIEKENIFIIDSDIYKSDLSLSSNIIFGLEETDSEVLFKFKYVDSDKVIPLLKPKTSGSNISPFSSKNLPKNKDYIIPDDELTLYKEIIAQIPSEGILAITHTTNKFVKTLATKKNTIENIKADMKIKGLKGKEYIHSIGQWNNYIKYLKEELKL